MKDAVPNLSTPLFQEPPADLDEDSTWGFLTGGMAWTEGDLPATDFMLAADVLAEKALAEGDESFRYRNPVLYLYRHALELFLKRVVGPNGKSHDLSDLIKRFEEVLEREFNQHLPPSVKARLQEWAEHDPRSTAFRYSQAPANTDHHERWVDIRHLRAVMRFLADNFQHMESLRARQS